MREAPDQTRKTENRSYELRRRTGSECPVALPEEPPPWSWRHETRAEDNLRREPPNLPELYYG